jgi:murein DD-endopeptidase MepM/ murein hydrolase activator NlpD
MSNQYKLGSLAFIAVVSLGGATLMPPKSAAPDLASAPTLGVMYAAPVERVETHVLSSGQTLSGVLAQARITGQDMADVLLGLRQHLNPRALGVRSEVTVRRWARSGEPRAIEVRLNADSTVRLVKADARWNGQVVITPTEIDTVYGGGVIRATLYEAVVFDESGLPIPDRRGLVYELASIYDTKLNFAREIQAGDSYRLVYEREVRPDGTARSRRILAAEIVNSGRIYPAYWFEGSSEVRGYFDAEARPLASGFSKYPIAFPRITSSFNPNRYHPILGVHRAHVGTDFGAPSGTPVMATADGTVTVAGVNGGYGNMIEIRHFNGYTTRYAHLRRFAPGIRVGTRVTQKQVIGEVGATGLATAPHLHYELRINGRAVDAMRARLPDTPPIPGALRERFLAVAQERATLLEHAARSSRYAAARSLSASAPAGEL